MKVIKVLISIIILLALIILAPTFFAYEAFHYSFLSYDENVTALSDGDFIRDAVEDLADINLEEKAALNGLLQDQNLAAFSKRGLGKFVNSAFENSLSYVFLRSDKVAEFDKQFIDDFKEDSIAMVIDTITNNAAYDLFAKNLQNVDQGTAAIALKKTFESVRIKHEQAEVDEIITELYADGNPSEDKLKEALVDFANKRVIITFEPEAKIEKALYVPRAVVEKTDDILGKLMFINIALLILLLICCVYNRNVVFFWLLLASIASLGLFQLLRFFRYYDFSEQLQDSQALGGYFDKMSALLIRNVNYISLGVLAALVLYLIILIIVNKAMPRQKDEESKYRFKAIRLILAIAIVGALSYFNYVGYTEVRELQDNLESYNFETELEDLKDFKDIFEFKIDL